MIYIKLFLYISNNNDIGIECLELLRAGYTKNELKPLGAWQHDGVFKSYNQYWDCCFGLDRNTKYCVPHQS